MLELIQHYAIANSALIGFISFVAGVLVGIRVTIFHDRRRRLVEQVHRIRTDLLNGRTFTPVDADLLGRLLPRHRRRGFQAAWANYRQAYREHYVPLMNAMTAEDREVINAATDGLLRYTDYR